MIKICCDICQQEVNEHNSTQIILKDEKGVSFDLGMIFSTSRKWKGIICDKCLAEFRKPVNSVEVQDE